MIEGTFIPGFLSAATAATLTPIARGVALRFGVLDFPNVRSSHTVPTPRTGGYAIVIAIALGAVTAGTFRDPQLRAVGAGSLVLILLAAIDEVKPLPRVGRFLTQLAVGSMVAFTLELSHQHGSVYTLALFTAAALWTVWMTNAYNFMDGVNGLAASAAVVSGVTMTILFSEHGDLRAAALAIVIAGAAAGFLAWNMTGSIFMGDVGSSTFGFLFACLILRARESGMLIPATLPLAPILFDATLTVIIRAAQGQRFFSTPHRSHCYQLLVQRGWSHLSVTALWTGLGIACAAVAVRWSALDVLPRAATVLSMFAAHFAVFALSRRDTLRWLVSRNDLR